MSKKTNSIGSRAKRPDKIIQPQKLKKNALATTDTTQKYMAEIRKYAILSREKEKEIALLYEKTKDPKYVEILIKANLRFVVKIALEYSKFGHRLIDLIQEGNLGLMHAVKEFNPHKGVRVTSYAVWWIRGYIQEYLMKQYSIVKIGTTQNQRKLFYQLKKQKPGVEKVQQQESLALLSSSLGIPQKEVVEMSQRLSGRDLSLDQPINSQQGTSFIDLQEDPTNKTLDERLGGAQESALLHKNIKQIKPQLNQRELYMLENRLLSENPMTLQKIGDTYGITREAVRQMEARLIQKIKNQIIKNKED